MNSFINLLKEKIIDFDKIMIEKYHLLNLNETECLVLIKLNKLTFNSKYYKQENLLSTMSITVDVLNDIMFKLVQNGFISLELTALDNREYLEIVSLDLAYQRLWLLIDEKEVSLSDKTASNMKDICLFLESKFQRSLTPSELSTIKRWFYEYKYQMSLIEEVVKVNKKTQISTLDRYLFQKTHTEIKKNDAVDIYEKLYGKKTG